MSFSDDDDEYDRVFDLNEDALFQLQNELVCYERQMGCSSSSGVAGSSNENNSSAIQMLQNTRLNDTSNQKIQSTSHSIDDQILKFQYQLQLLQQENEQYRREKEEITQQKMMKEGEINVVRARLSQIETDNVKLKTELMRQESLKRQDIERATISLKSQIDKLKTQLLFEAQESNSNMMAFTHKMTENQNTPAPTTKKKDTCTERTSFPLKRRRKFRKTSYQQCQNSISNLLETVYLILKVTPAAGNQNQIFQVYQALEYSIKKNSTDCFALVLQCFDFNYENSPNLIENNVEFVIETVNEAITFYMETCSTSKISIKSLLRTSRKFLGKVDLISQSEFLRLARIICPENIFKILDIVEITCTESNHIKPALHNHEHCRSFIECIGLSTIQIFRTKQTELDRLIKFLASCIDRLVADEELLSLFTRQILGYLLIMVIQEAEFMSDWSLHFCNSMKLAFEMANFLCKLVEKNNWFKLEDQKLSLNGTDEVYTMVSVADLMKHIKRRPCLKIING